MDASGIYLQLMIGKTIPVPVPAPLAEALSSVQVTCSDEAASGFELRFEVGKSGVPGPSDPSLMANPLFQVLNRVIIVVSIAGTPRVLMDGVITNVQLSPGMGTSPSVLTVIGEDLSYVMDEEEKSAEHPAQSESIIATKIIASYFQYGLIPAVIPPPSVSPPNPLDKVPSQQKTDLAYLKEMAGRYGYVFFIIPGPAPYTNTAYWGPPRLMEAPQRALTVDMGPATNVNTISFRNNALAPVDVSGDAQDKDSNEKITIKSYASTRPPLSMFPAAQFNARVRKKKFRAKSGMTSAEAFAEAQGIKDASSEAVTAEGELDTARYGDMLTARGIVGVRGVGFMYDGLYYVKSVTHNIARGAYTQSFSLAREGLGALSPVVRP